jgi:hypothetical protein
MEVCPQQWVEAAQQGDLCRTLPLRQSANTGSSFGKLSFRALRPTSSSVPCSIVSVS